MSTKTDTPIFRLSKPHLLSIEDLKREDIVGLLDLAGRIAELSPHSDEKKNVLAGLTQINLFFEDSTRTQSSFELAGKRLGANLMNMAVKSSSINKGETLIDTTMTLNAMRPDVLVVRHFAAGAVELVHNFSLVHDDIQDGSLFRRGRRAPCFGLRRSVQSPRTLQK
jgi:aspartate carbamoyltransferase catalytic subunit